MMRALAREGVAVLFVSSELEEIIAVADRVLVMHEGRIAGGLAREALTEEAIMRLATGAATGAGRN
jgi:ribose transport system ATP-binding protein